jgi:fructuronate reductase
MRLNNGELENKNQWGKAGIELPAFNREAMIKATLEAPEWVHFGTGNLFRAFPAVCQQILLDKGIEKTGIIIVAGRDGEILDKVFKPCDNLTLAVTLKADGGIKKKVVASVAKSLWMGKPEEFDEVRRIFRAPSLKMASFTITEKGYNIKDGKGELLADAAADFAAGPANPAHYMGKIAALCYERYLAGEASGKKMPLALVSMDNCSHNGDKLFAAVEAFAAAWTEKGLTEKDFLAYIRDRNTISFPWSMIDKITPGPDKGVRAMLEKSGFTDTETQVTGRGTQAAPFVNAEEPQYLVIEDNFPAGRPALDKTGVLFTDRATVDKVEKMKVCTCLNPLHTALAIFGCLLGYTKISEEMKNKDLVKLVEIIGYREGLPVVVDPGIISPKQFLDEVVKVRIPNPFMPDMPQRIATDSSQKIPIRFGETIKAYLAGSSAGVKLDVQDLKLIPLVLAAWIRYLMGINDEGEPFTVSPDPLLESLAPAVRGIKLGDKGPFSEALKPIFSDSRIFGVNLYEAGLGERTEAYFTELAAAKGAVAATLKKYVN